jgi:hypothetical protein
MAIAETNPGAGYAPIFTIQPLPAAKPPPESSVQPNEIRPGASGISATSFGRQPVRLLAFNPVAEGMKVLKLLQQGGSNNIVPFLRAVSQAPPDKKAWLVEKGIELMGGASKFINLLRPFVPAFAAIAERLNPVLLPAAVLQELDGWFGSGAQLSSGDLPFREPGRPPPDPLTPISPADIPYYKAPLGNFNPPDIEPPPVPKKAPVPVIEPVPTEAQGTAEINLRIAQTSLASAKNAVDQAFARPPILGLEGFRDDVDKLAKALNVYDQAIAAARAVGLGNVEALVKQFQRTAAQALDLLKSAPEREKHLKAAADKQAANPNNPLNLGNVEEVRRAINFGSFPGFMTAVGGVSGMVQKGLIKTPADFANLFGRKMFQQDELNLFTKSLQNFIANPGKAGAALVKAAEFLIGCIQAYKNPILSFRFPEPLDLENAGKPQSPSQNPGPQVVKPAPNKSNPPDPLKPKPTEQPNRPDIKSFSSEVVTALELIEQTGQGAKLEAWLSAHPNATQAEIKAQVQQATVTSIQNYLTSHKSEFLTFARANGQQPPTDQSVQALAKRFLVQSSTNSSDGSKHLLGPDGKPLTGNDVTPGTPDEANGGDGGKGDNGGGRTGGGAGRWFRGGGSGSGGFPAWFNGIWAKLTNPIVVIGGGAAIGITAWFNSKPSNTNLKRECSQYDVMGDAKQQEAFLKELSTSVNQDLSSNNDSKQAVISGTAIAALTTLAATKNPAMVPAYLMPIVHQNWTMDNLKTGESASVLTACISPKAALATVRNAFNFQTPEEKVKAYASNADALLRFTRAGLDQMTQDQVSNAYIIKSGKQFNEFVTLTIADLEKIQGRTEAIVNNASKPAKIETYANDTTKQTITGFTAAELKPLKDIQVRLENAIKKGDAKAATSVFEEFGKAYEQTLLSRKSTPAHTLIYFMPAAQAAAYKSDVSGTLNLVKSLGDQVVGAFQKQIIWKQTASGLLEGPVAAFSRRSITDVSQTQIKAMIDDVEKLMKEYEAANGFQKNSARTSSDVVITYNALSSQRNQLGQMLLQAQALKVQKEQSDTSKDALISTQKSVVNSDYMVAKSAWDTRIANYNKAHNADKVVLDPDIKQKMALAGVRPELQDLPFVNGAVCIHTLGVNATTAAKICVQELKRNFPGTDYSILNPPAILTNPPAALARYEGNILEDLEFALKTYFELKIGGGDVQVPSNL